MALGFMGDFLGTVRDWAAGLTGRIKGIFNAGPKFKLIAAGAIFGTILVIFAIMLLLIWNSRSRRPTDSEAVMGLFRMKLPPEDLFLDDEPDFLPDMLLGRERRDAWNVDDVRPYWTDPADEGAGVYKDVMGAVVDGIMERVP
jgi:hypothetical protein